MWSWCKQWFSGASRTPRPPARKKRDCRLQMEALEDRTTPAPVTGPQAFGASGNSASDNFVPSSSASSGQTFVTGTSPFANEGTTFTGAITPNIFPPVIVNSLDQSLLQMQAS